MTVLFFLCLLLGFVAGLRAMIAPAAVAWAAHLGWIDLSGGWLAFMGYAWTPWIFTVLALAELVTDQLPGTPSRTVTVQFATRFAMGALGGSCLGDDGGNLFLGLVAAVIGAGAGTLIGADARAKLAAHFGRDRPAALIEDGVAIIGAALIVMAAA